MNEHGLTGDRERLFRGFVAAGKLAAPVPPAGLADEVLRRLAPRARRRRPRLLLVAALPAAAAILLFLLVGMPFLGRHGGQPLVADGGYATVEFRYAGAAARSVALVGDFNEWRGDADPLRRDGDGWSVAKRLRAGQLHKYAFLVDGTAVLADPAARRTVDDGFGGRTSVVAVD